MSYTIEIQTKEQFEYIKRIVENSHRMMHSNTSAYVEYLDTVDALKKAFDNPAVTKNPEPELPSPAKKKTSAKKRSAVAKLPVFCKEHPTYGAKRAPRTDCKTCWEAYKRLNPTLWAPARRKFERTQRANNA